MVQLDLKGSNDNLVVQGKLMIYLSTIPSTTATNSRPAGSSSALTSLPPYDSLAVRVNNTSVAKYLGRQRFGRQRLGRHLLGQHLLGRQLLGRRLLSQQLLGQQLLCQQCFGLHCLSQQCLGVRTS